MSVKVLKCTFIAFRKYSLLAMISEQITLRIIHTVAAEIATCTNPVHVWCQRASMPGAKYKELAIETVNEWGVPSST